MKFGYMSGFRSDLVTEIEFAKKYFDFTEITIQPTLLKGDGDAFLKLKNALSGFEVLGHIHWEIAGLKDIIKNIEILDSLGAKKITIHPFENLSIDENARIMNKINEVLQKKKIELLIENVSSAPYNSLDNISKLFKNVPSAGFTLDVGHANRIFELDNFINALRTRMRHIHLHDNVGDFDHLFYDNENRLSAIFSKIKSTGYDGTVLMETFSVMKNGKNVSQEFMEIKKLHIEQLKKIRE